MMRHMGYIANNDGEDGNDNGGDLDDDDNDGAGGGDDGLHCFMYTLKNILATINVK